MILAALIWGFLILIFYSDSMMSNSHTFVYSALCLVLAGAGILLIVKSYQ